MRARGGMLLDNGRYKLVTKIAVGGMGEVWRAHDVLTNAPVAVKVLRPEFTHDVVSLKRLRFEARNAAMLNHPNITQVLNYGEIEGTGYIVMEYVEGQSLADVLATHTTIAPLRLLPILIEASLGLHAAHTEGVVHRDVKPGNILLGSSDQVKLTDFGISVAPGQQTLTDTGKVMGTAQYLAPEQALGKDATPAGDLYALGVIAYEALVGERPFRGSNYVAIALAQVNQPPPPLPASVEKSLGRLVMRLLAKDPAARPHDGAELAGLFGEVLEVHRELASRLLAARTGSGPPPDLLRSAPQASPTTAEQPARPEAPPTDAAPVVDGGDQVMAADSRHTHPPSPPPLRRFPPPVTPEVAMPLEIAPDVPPKRVLEVPLPPSPAIQPAAQNGFVPGAAPGEGAGGASAQGPGGTPGPQAPAAPAGTGSPAAAPGTGGQDSPDVPGPDSSGRGEGSAVQPPTPPRAAPGPAGPGAQGAGEAQAPEPGRPGVPAPPAPNTPDAPFQVGSGPGRPGAPEPGQPGRPARRSVPLPGSLTVGIPEPSGSTPYPSSVVVATPEGGVATPNQFAPAAASPQAGASRVEALFQARPRRFSAAWWAPLLAGIGLLVIVLIGLLTALYANNSELGAPAAPNVLSTSAYGWSVIVDSAATDAAHLRER